LKLYRARAFLRQTWSHGGEQEAVESEARQLAGMVDKRRTVLTVGNLAVIDIFDDNRYSHDPRTQFMNWSLMTQGAFDYAADARGYSWGRCWSGFTTTGRCASVASSSPRSPTASRWTIEFSNTTAISWK
jgi:hypothetical protein